MTAMLPVAEALRIVLECAPVLSPREVPYLDGLGRILEEEVRSDRDHPEFDKSLMDGYAVVASDLATAPKTLDLLEEIPAGRDPAGLRSLRAGAASRIMTGAPLPPGADAVLIVEETEAVPGDPGRVRALRPVKPGDNLARRGAEVRRGQVLLAPGDFLGPAEIGVLAACGRTQVRTGGRPEVAVLATGDEIVDPEHSPRPGQIRNSNGPLLLALAGRSGAVARDLGIARDQEPVLRAAIERGFAGDVLLLSGGVSMGLYDLTGKALRALGAEILFEKVAIKPGKPFTFARRGATLIFGCPGNPVSAYVIFQVFVRAALRRMMGFRSPAPSAVRGVLASAVRQRPGRAGYHQAIARPGPGGCAVEVLTTSGSADFVSCARGNALAVVPPDVTALAPGDPVEVILLDDHLDR